MEQRRIGELERVASELVAPGKGILAADESSKTIRNRFDEAGLEDSPDNHRIYRQTLFETPGIQKFISGVILYDETIKQTTPNGVPLAQVLSQKGIIPGIKVDGGTEELENGELKTKGLDGLAKRLAEYAQLGAKFTKWREVISIKGDELPTRAAIESSADHLSEFARLSQEAGLVPIIEPEVQMDRKGYDTHTIERCDEVTRETLKTVFVKLRERGVSLKGMLLKPNMIIAGKKSEEQASAEEVAKRTQDALRDTVPQEVAGVVFLSGGQSDQDAVRHLALINQINQALDESIDYFEPQLSFSYGRGLQAPAYQALGGSLTDPEKLQAAQEAFLKAALSCSEARYGKYEETYSKM